ncbi:MAG: prolyl oligopeptidase family serine peptidase [Pseudomonadales bacterium]|nr:prolyl oligopeptidase family serine peptidase [Pseudomonadales bacterium]
MSINKIVHTLSNLVVSSLQRKILNTNESDPTSTLPAELNLSLHDVASKSLERKIPVSVLSPNESSRSFTDVPVFIHLDGGVGDRMSLARRAGLLTALVVTEVIPASIHVSFSGGANQFFHGPWEKWVSHELPEWLANQFNCSVAKEKLVLTGISAGGYGALKIAFKNPQRFKAVGVMEPVTMPCLDWPRQHTRASWWMLQESAESVWGAPFPETFLANHPPNIAQANADAIKAADLDIYLECGDEDLLNLQDGAEFLHRVLWDCDVPHEYHLTRWADHGGFSIDDRFIETLAFLSASLAGGLRQSRDVQLKPEEQAFIEYVLSGGPARGEPPPEGAFGGDEDSELTVMASLWAPLRNIAVDLDPDMARHFGRIPKRH